MIAIIKLSVTIDNVIHIPIFLDELLDFEELCDGVGEVSGIGEDTGEGNGELGDTGPHLIESQ